MDKPIEEEEEEDKDEEEDEEGEEKGENGLNIFILLASWLGLGPG